MGNIEVKGFTVHDVSSDKSVGVSSVAHTVDGPFFFDGEAELELFRSALCYAFELVCDSPRAITFEESDRL